MAPARCTTRLAPPPAAGATSRDADTGGKFNALHPVKAKTDITNPAAIQRSFLIFVSS